MIVNAAEWALLNLLLLTHGGHHHLLYCGQHVLHIACDNQVDICVLWNELIIRVQYRNSPLCCSGKFIMGAHFEARVSLCTQHRRRNCKILRLSRAWCQCCMPCSVSIPVRGRAARACVQLPLGGDPVYVALSAPSTTPHGCSTDQVRAISGIIGQRPSLPKQPPRQPSWRTLFLFLKLGDQGAAATLLTGSRERDSHRAASNMHDLGSCSCVMDLPPPWAHVVAP